MQNVQPIFRSCDRRVIVHDATRSAFDPSIHPPDMVSLVEPTSNITPSSRSEVIQQLIDGVDRYNPDNVSILEEYLATQCQNEEYDLMANLAILKLYVGRPLVMLEVEG